MTYRIIQSRHNYKAIIKPIVATEDYANNIAKIAKVQITDDDVQECQNGHMHSGTDAHSPTQARRRHQRVRAVDSSRMELTAMAQVVAKYSRD